MTGGQLNLARPATSAAGLNDASHVNQYAMQDPTKQYPQPEFEKQPQSPPGVA